MKNRKQFEAHVEELIYAEDDRLRKEVLHRSAHLTKDVKLEDAPNVLVEISKIAQEVGKTRREDGAVLFDAYEAEHAETAALLLELRAALGSAIEKVRFLYGLSDAPDASERAQLEAWQSIHAKTDAIANPPPEEEKKAKTDDCTCGACTIRRLLIAKLEQVGKPKDAMKASDAEPEGEAHVPPVVAPETDASASA